MGLAEGAPEDPEVMGVHQDGPAAHGCRVITLSV
jgi:hypothetical protein